MHGFASRSAVVVSHRSGKLTAAASRARRLGFTLIEVLVAMTVTLILMGIVVTIFGAIGDNVSKNNSSMEMNDQLRTVKQRLQLDLSGVTAQMLPPRRDENGEGYFEIIEGPVGRLPPNTAPTISETYDTTQLPTAAINVASTGADTTVGDNDDILMFTTRSKGEMFLGRGVMWNTSAGQYVPTALQSPVAEVAWFIRGTTLYRRQLLVRPDLPLGPPLVSPPTVNAYMVPQPTMSGGTPAAAPNTFSGAIWQYPTNFYAVCDLSARAAGQTSALSFDLSPSPPPFFVVANSLEDLTKRENRFAHFPLIAAPGYGFPHAVSGWGVFCSTSPFGYTSLAGTVATTGRLGLPTLRECSSLYFPLPGTFELQQSGQAYLGDSAGNGTKLTATLNEPFDAWTNPNPAWVAQIGSPPVSTSVSDPLTGTLIGLFPDNTSSPSPYGTRYGEDVILTHVLSFDVRVWDPDAALIGVTDSTGATSMFAPGDPGYAKQVINWVMGTGPAGTSYAIVGRGAYVDLYYPGVFPVFELVNGLTLTAAQQTALNSVTTSMFSSSGISNSGLQAADPYSAAVYDTGSWHYENDGIDQGNMISGGNNGADEGTNGLDDNLDGVVDDLGELEAPPPYFDITRGGYPLRGIQVKIRCFDPDSQEIREVTIVQEFVPE